MKHTEQDAKRILEKEQLLKLNQNQPGLRQVLYYYNGLKEKPIDIRDESPEGVVFYNLQICYGNQKNVSEGSVEDVIWGFRQSGIPNNITWDGFRTLKKLGYLNFTNDMGVTLFGDPTPQMWYRWTQKYYNLLLKTTEGTQNLLVDDKIKGKDTTVDKVD